MKDQVEALQRKGVKAAKLDSTLDRSEVLAVWNGVRTGDLKILYVAPERSVICFDILLSVSQHILFTGSTMKVFLR